MGRCANIYLLLLLSSLPLMGWTLHSATAYFQIKEQQGQTIVLADFPPSLQQALLKHNPQLSANATQRQFLRALKDYGTHCLSLTNKYGESLPLTNVTALDRQIGAPTSRFQFTFQGTGFSILSNRFLFNVSDNAINRHSIQFNGKKVKVLTTPDAPNKMIDRHARKSYSTLLTFLLLLMIPAFFILKSLSGI